MTRLLIICEGQTEHGFVERLLAPHLLTFGIKAYATLLNPGPKQKGGGNVSVPRLAKHIRNEYHNRRFITTLVDYYGFKNINGRAKKQFFPRYHSHQGDRQSHPGHGEQPALGARCHHERVQALARCPFEVLI